MPTGAPAPPPGLAAPGPLAEPLRVLAQQRWFVIVFVASATLTSLALTYVFAEKYQSEVAISYRAQEVTRFKALQNEALGSPAPLAPFKVISQTLQEVLKSNAILEEVVRTLRLHEKPPAADGPWYKVWYAKAKDWAREYGGYAWMLLKYGRIVEEDPIAAAVRELNGNVKVRNYDSYVFRLEVRDRYPDRAARIADHMGKVLANWLLEFDRQPGRYRIDQLRVLLDEKSRALTERRKEIEALLTENRVASVQQETDRLTESLSALQLELSRLESEIARAKERRASVQAKLQTKERILGSAGPPAPSSEYIQPEDFKKLASQNLFDDVELRSLQAKHASLTQTIESISARLRKLPGIQNRLDTLKLSLAALEREHSLLSDGYQEAAVRATSPVSEVRILHPATVPAGPVSPIKVYHVLLSAVLGLLFAVGLVYVLDFFGIRVLFAARREEPPAPSQGPEAVPPAPGPEAPRHD